MGSGNVLFVVTSHDRMGVLRNRKTGIWLEDLAVPYGILSDAGYSVTVSSPLGGEVPVDPNSMKQTKSAFFNPEAWLERDKTVLQESVPLGEVRHEEFDALFYPGGYGSFWDLSVDRKNAGLLEEFVRSGRPVAAIRHGGTALLAAKNDAGNSILNGRRVTAATDDEERQMALDRVVPFSLGKRLQKCGADYICDEPWKPNVVTDGMLVTGQNTQSAGELARAMLSLMASVR